jgi:hypothetical protein
VRADGIRECNEVCIVDVVRESEELCVVVGIKAKFVILRIHGREHVEAEIALNLGPASYQVSSVDLFDLSPLLGHASIEQKQHNGCTW